MNSWVVYNIQKFYSVTRNGRSVSPNVRSTSPNGHSVSRNGDFNCAYSYNLSGLMILVVHSMHYR